MPIRDATLRDAFFITELDESEFNRYAGPNALTPLRLMTEPNTFTLIYAHDDLEDLQLGFAIVQWKNGGSYIPDIAVAPTQRHRGIGKILLEASETKILEMAKRPHLIGLHVGLHNALGRQFFADQGFKYFQPFVPRFYANGEPALWMVKTIG